MRIKNLGLYLLVLLMLLTTAPAEPAAEPPRGGMAYFCALLGISAGLSFATGNGIGLFASMVSAHHHGCF